MIKLFYCHVCEQYTDQAKARLKDLIRVKVENRVQYEPLKIIDETLDRNVHAEEYYCCVDSSRMTAKEFEEKDCPHAWEPLPSVVNQTCRYCGSKRYGKVVFND